MEQATPLSREVRWLDRDPTASKLPLMDLPCPLHPRPNDRSQCRRLRTWPVSAAYSISICRIPLFPRISEVMSMRQALHRLSLLDTTTSGPHRTLLDTTLLRRWSLVSSRLRVPEALAVVRIWEASDGNPPPMLHRPRRVRTPTSTPTRTRPILQMDWVNSSTKTLLAVARLAVLSQVPPRPTTRNLDRASSGPRRSNHCCWSTLPLGSFFLHIPHTNPILPNCNDFSERTQLSG